ncbi:MAG: DMT family transporter, partial [Bacillota bacterium]
GLYLAVAKLLFSVIHPFLLGLLVCGGTGLFFFLYLLLKRQIGPCLHAGRRLMELHLVGFLAGIIYLLELQGLKLSSAINAGILLRTDLLFSLLLGFFLLRERLSKVDVAAMAAMVAGVLLVMGVSPAEMESFSVGDLMITGAAFILAVNAYLIKGRLKDVENTIIAFYNTTITALWFAASATAAGIWGHWGQIPQWGWTLVGLCTVLNIAQYLSYYQAIKLLPIWLLRTLSLVTPVITVAAGAALLRDTVTLSQLIGILLVGGGVVIISLAQGRKAGTSFGECEAKGRISTGRR